jgi:hypothetical protein
MGRGSALSVTMERMDVYEVAWKDAAARRPAPSSRSSKKP